MKTRAQGTALETVDGTSPGRHALLITAAEWRSLIDEDPQADPTWPCAWLRALALRDSSRGDGADATRCAADTRTTPRLALTRTDAP